MKRRASCFQFWLTAITSLLLAAGVQDLKPDVLNPDVSDIVTDSKMYVVEFYSKFCGSCTEFLPILDQASKLLPKQSGLTVGKYSIEEEKGRKVRLSNSITSLCRRKSK